MGSILQTISELPPIGGCPVPESFGVENLAAVDSAVGVDGGAQTGIFAIKTPAGVLEGAIRLFVLDFAATVDSMTHEGAHDLVLQGVK